MTSAPSSRSPSVPLTQRDLRAPRPRHPAHSSGPARRAPTTAEHQARLAARLTARDRWLTRLLAEHRVLTSAQIAEAAFPSRHAANVRLRELYRWRVLDRFQPYTGRGAAHLHYVLDTAGHTLLAAEDGLDPAALRWRPEQAIAIAHSLRLAHTVAVNGFFTALIHTGRRPGSQARLDAWWSEARCARLFADHVRPDGYGRWTEPGAHAARPGERSGEGTAEFFLEHDQGTETYARLAGKLAGYAALAAVSGITTPVLFRFRGTGRETAARAALAVALARLDDPGTVPVATSAADHAPPADPDTGPDTGHDTGPDTGYDTGPAGPAWLPVHPGHRATPPGPVRRLRLSRLPAAWRLPPPAAPHDGGDHDGGNAEPVDPAPEPVGRARLALPAPMPPTDTDAGGHGGRW